MDKKRWLPSKLTRRFGNQQRWFKVLSALSGTDTAYGSREEGRLTPKRRLISGLKTEQEFLGAEERTGIPGRGHCLYTERRNHRYKLGSPNIEPSLCWWAVVVGKRRWMEK